MQIDKYYKMVGKLFKYYRKQQNSTQAEISIGICSRKTYIQIEEGKSQVKDIYYRKIAEKLKPLFAQWR